MRKRGAVPAPVPSFSEVARMSAAEVDALLEAAPQEAARRLAAAAQYGVIEAQLRYAQLLLDGRGVARDPTAAFAWFRIAAEAGSVEATNMLGRCHELGWGTPADPAAAADRYRDAALRGLDWGQYNYANLLARGAGVPLDRDDAFRWYWRAAQQRHAKSMNLVGRFLEEGWGAPADPAAAAIWYRRAAEGGDFRGQFNHGTVLLRQGQVEAAVRWFRAATETGTRGFLRSMAGVLGRAPQAAVAAVATEVLARCCEGGEAEDFLAYGRALAWPREPQRAAPAAARAWLRRAHLAGHPEATAALARLDAEQGRWWRFGWPGQLLGSLQFRMGTAGRAGVPHRTGM